MKGNKQQKGDTLHELIDKFAKIHSNEQMFFKILQQLMKGQQGNLLPDSSSQEEFAHEFAVFLSVRSWR